MEETLPRISEWQQTAEYQEARAKMIRLMSEDPAAYRKFVKVLERLEDQGKAAYAHAARETGTMVFDPDPH
ncbi:MAG: hypothetical protein ACKV22_33455 [Bryobacteraceae bacterium]